NKYEFPVKIGSEGEIGIKIKSLRSQSKGIITLDPGYKNTGSCESAITFLNGEDSILRYRGYAIEDLAEKSSFLEVAYLLIYGELPTEKELNGFREAIKSEARVDEGMETIVKGFPKDARPMGVLAALTSAMEAFNPENIRLKSDEDEEKAIIKMLAKFPILVAWTLRNGLGQDFVDFDQELGYIDNLLQMMFKTPGEDYHIDKKISAALNKLLILHADHEQNCSASTVRIVGSSNASIFS